MPRILLLDDLRVSNDTAIIDSEIKRGIAAQCSQIAIATGTIQECALLGVVDLRMTGESAESIDRITHGGESAERREKLERVAGSNESSAALV